MSYLILDLETTIKKSYGRTANPFDKDNRIVAIGLKPQNEDVEGHYITYLKTGFKFFTPKFKVIVGHNIKFDLLYLWGYEALQDWFRRGGRIWDTQLAEYYLTGQQHKYPALRDIAVNKYGCPEREKLMEKYWGNKNTIVDEDGYLVEPGCGYYETFLGDFNEEDQPIYVSQLKEGYKHIIGSICTSEIPQELVLEDVKNDVLDTESIYLQQLEKAEELGMGRFLYLAMDGLLATTEAEYNGMYIDQTKLLENKKKLEIELSTKTEMFVNKILPYWYKNIDFSVSNPGHLSVLLFGGILKHKVIIPVLDAEGNCTYFKSGDKKDQIKTKKEIRDVEVKGLGISQAYGIETKRQGIYETNEEALLEVQKKVKGDTKEIITEILEIRKINKQLNTYYDNVLELIYDDSRIHPAFNHVSTDTGRLSASNPNVQNQPHAGESRVLEHFSSRFPRGSIVTGDYSQIEIVVQAQLSEDSIYITDVKKGIDFHTKRLALSEGCEYQYALKMIKEVKDPIWIEKRKQIKVFSFQRAYGAGSWLISQTTGIPEEQVKELIRLEDLEYCGLKEYNDQLELLVKATAKQLPNSPLKQGWYKTFTGKKYYTKQRFDKKGNIGWVVPQIKNYGIQGTAFDIAIIQLGKYWRENLIHNRDKYLFINMVHDSFMLDCKSEYIQEAVESLQFLTQIEKMCKEEFDYDWEIPVKLEVKTGDSWYEC